MRLRLCVLVCVYVCARKTGGIRFGMLLTRAGEGSRRITHINTRSKGRGIFSSLTSQCLRPLPRVCKHRLHNDTVADPVVSTFTKAPKLGKNAAQMSEDGPAFLHVYINSEEELKTGHGVPQTHIAEALWSVSGRLCHARNALHNQPL